MLSATLAPVETTENVDTSRIEQRFAELVLPKLKAFKKADDDWCAGNIGHKERDRAREEFHDALKRWQWTFSAGETVIRTHLVPDMILLPNQQIEIAGPHMTREMFERVRTDWMNFGTNYGGYYPEKWVLAICNPIDGQGTVHDVIEIPAPNGRGDQR
ncbi:hypothetical protein PQI66_04365 [Corynebacterium sp. USCH3]|uniref:hypothetical protein n=1 Tax=Corynebacterium sp. USCH3 TaxID=3024840 RepID=UPI0030AF419A